MDDLDIFLKDTYTLSSLKLRLRILRAYFSKIFFGGADSLMDRDMLWINSLPKDFLAKFDKNNITNIFSELEKKINQIQPLIIYLPFEATDEVILSIGQLIRTTFQNPALLLDIKYDPNLIAGCALVWKGIYRDYSLRATIEQRKEEVLQSFKKFLR